MATEVSSLGSSAVLVAPAALSSSDGNSGRSTSATSLDDSEPEAITKIFLDTDALKARYDKERDKRIAANPAAFGQYRLVDHHDPFFGRFLDDPYIEKKIQRESVQEETEVVIIGGGYGGQLAAVRLLEKDITDIKIIEKGGDFGGTWYWNRYPGAQCDIESYCYMPLLYETGYIPSEKYARCAELFTHAQAIGQRFNLYSRTMFQTEVTGLVWDESTSTWLVRTDRDDSIRARYVISASGPMHKPKLPGVRGLESFNGHSFHSSRWDYDYTGGDSKGNLQKLRDKRVGIIGTGATAVQIVPQLGKWAKQLYVFQRTPSSIDVRNNRPTDPSWARTLGENWQQKRMDNFNTIVSGGHQDHDLVADGWTNIFSTIALKPPGLAENAGEDIETAEKTRQLADFVKMEQIRARVDSIVKDSNTAEKLKPFYNQFCKRPCFHDEYLQTFNLPNVALIDTDGQGVESITETGVVAAGTEYEVDCLIYATGFELVTDFTRRSGYDLIGEGGIPLSTKWRDGPSTLHGYATRGFPNHFFVQVIQAVQTQNVIHGTGELAKHFAYIIGEAKNRKIKSLQPTQDAEDAWVQTIIDANKYKAAYYAECTPGYFNNEGKLDSKAARSATYGGGTLKYFELLRQWRDNGDLDGLETSFGG